MVVVSGGSNCGVRGRFVIQRSREVIGAENTEEISSRNERVLLEELAVRTGIVCGQQSPGFEEHFGSRGRIGDGGERERRNEWVGVVGVELPADILTEELKGLRDAGPYTFSFFWNLYMMKIIWFVFQWTGRKVSGRPCEEEASERERLERYDQSPRSLGRS